MGAAAAHGVKHSAIYLRCRPRGSPLRKLDGGFISHLDIPRYKNAAENAGEGASLQTLVPPSPWEGAYRKLVFPRPSPDDPGAQQQLRVFS